MFGQESGDVFVLSVSRGFNRKEFVKWLTKTHCFKHNIGSISNAFHLADSMIAGSQVEAHLLDEETEVGASVCLLTKKVVEEEIDPCIEFHKKQEEYFQLRDKGAAGDVEAAIMYCKLEMQGLVSHAAFG